MSRRGAFTLAEVLVALALGAVVLVAVWSVFNAAGRTAPGLGAHASLQLGTQLALLELNQKLQESIAIERLTSGTSLSYFVVRGKTNETVVGYQVVDAAASAKAGRRLYQLWLASSRGAGTDTQRKVLGQIERCRFTATSAGVLQLHMDLFEDGKSHAVLTSVRLRNLPSEALLP